MESIAAYKVRPQQQKTKGGRYLQVWLNADYEKKYDVVKEYNGYQPGKETDTIFQKDWIDTYFQQIKQTERQQS